MNWKQGLLLLAVLSGCTETRPPLVPPPDDPRSVPPELRSVSAPNFLLRGETATITVRIWPGYNPITGLSVDFEGDGQIDTVATPGAWQLLHYFSHRYDSDGQMRITARVWDDFGLTDSSAYELTVAPFRFATLLEPSRGVAPLAVELRILHEYVTQFEAIRVDWEGDAVVDTIFDPTSAESRLAHVYPVGVFALQVAAALNDTSTARSDTIVADNTPPWGSLPLVQLTDPNSPVVVNLVQHFDDQQTPSAELNFELLAQTVPGLAVLDSGRLTYHWIEGVPLEGEVQIRVTDEHGGSILRTQSYVMPNFDLTQLTLSIADLETDAPVLEGVLSIAAQSVRFTPDHPFVVFLVQPSPYYRVLAYGITGTQSTSYRRSVLMPATQDSSATIAVVTFEQVWQTGLIGTQFRDLNEEARQIPITDGQSVSGLGSIRFANASAGFESGGYTIYVEREGLAFSQDSLTEGEQLYITQVAAAEVLAHIPDASRRPQLVQAQADAPTYYEDGEPQESGLILIVKHHSPGVDIFDDGGNGSVDRAVIYLSRDFDDVEIIRGLLRVLAAPAMNAVSSVLPERSILHGSTTATSLTDADKLLLTIAAKTEPGIFIENLFSEPG